MLQNTETKQQKSENKEKSLIGLATGEKTIYQVFYGHELHFSHENDPKNIFPFMRV